MIITDFNNWLGYKFGNKLLGLNNLIQISKYYNQDYWFTPFNGLELFDIVTNTKSYNNQPYEIININNLINNKESIIFDNDKVYYLEYGLNPVRKYIGSNILWNVSDDYNNESLIVLE